jgi:hypothetical protein
MIVFVDNIAESILVYSSEFYRWFSPGTSVSSTNKTDLNDIVEILVESGVKHHSLNTKSVIRSHI